VTQLHHVLLCCELSGITIRAICSDAGTTNQHLFNLLSTKKLNVSDGDFLNDDAVSFLNPFHDDSHIYLFFFSVHLAKSFRNNLLASDNDKLISDGIRDDHRRLTETETEADMA
jgi:hypothetical protein